MENEVQEPTKKDESIELCHPLNLPVNLKFYDYKKFINEEEVENLNPNDLKDQLKLLIKRNKFLEEQNHILGQRTPNEDKRIAYLEEKCRHLKTETTYLERSLDRAAKEQSEFIDRLMTNIRRHSLQTTETECLMQSLKLKLPHLEDDNKDREKALEMLSYRFDDKSYEKIKSLEREITWFEDSNKELMEKVVKLEEKNHQINQQMESMTEEDQQRVMEYKEKILKVKGKLAQIELANNDTEKQLDLLKTEEAKVADFHRQRLFKIASKLDEMILQVKGLKNSLGQIETENNELGKQAKKLRLKIIAYKKTDTETPDTVLSIINS